MRSLLKPPIRASVGEALPLRLDYRHKMGEGTLRLCRVISHTRVLRIFLTSMKKRITMPNVKQHILLLLLVLCGHAAFSQDADQTFVVEDGAFPWHDRVDVWALADVPVSLAGAVMPQQSCGDRALNVAGSPASVTLAVWEKDLEKLMNAFPSATETGERLSVKSTKDATVIPYIVLKLPDPPQKIEVTPPLRAGLLLLKIEGSGGSPSPTEQIRPTPQQAQAATEKPAAPALQAFAVPQKEVFHIYLLMGQSNMVGRDTAGLESQTLDERVGFLDAAKHWYVAREPMHVGGSGIGLGIPFAQEMLKRTAGKDCKIGLVPCAVGGTPLKRWEKGGDLYERAVARAKEALAAGVLKGVLWHQGESDSEKPEDAESYGQRLTQMFQDLRADLQAPEVPIVVGQLGEFVRFPYAKTVQDAIKGLPQHLPHVGFADSQGLPHKGDSLHFSADAEREFGRRYADVMEQLQKGRPRED